MKITRPLATTAGALALVTGVASVALVGGGDAVAAGKPSSAFGASLTIANNSVIDPLPLVTSTDGKLVEDSVVALPQNPVVTGGIINASAQNGNAKSSVTNLGVGDGLLAQLPDALKTPLNQACTQLVTALDPVTNAINQAVLNQLLPQIDTVLQQISDATDGSPLDLSALGALDLTKLTDAKQLAGLCDVLSGKAKAVGADAVIAECNGTTGTTTVTGLKALGLPVDVGVNEVNKKIKVSELLTVTVNRQTKNADGTFTVDALNVNLLGGQVDLTIASATCGDVGGKINDQTDAPSPTPTQANVPVTG